jgi:hypothetical protein
LRISLRNSPSPAVFRVLVTVADLLAQILKDLTLSSDAFVNEKQTALVSLERSDSHAAAVKP